VKVLLTADGVWRAELWPDGWRLFHHGGLVLTRGTLDQLVNKMLDFGGRPEDLTER
jgi:hypothetical protein